MSNKQIVQDRAWQAAEVVTSARFWWRIAYMAVWAATMAVVAGIFLLAVLSKY